MSDHRSLSIILLRSLVLRLVVLLTQTYLLHIRRHPSRSSQSLIPSNIRATLTRPVLQQLALYTIFPHIALIDNTASIAQFFFSLTWNPTRRTPQFLFLQLASVSIPFDAGSALSTGSAKASTSYVSLRLCDSRRIIRSSSPSFISKSSASRMRTRRLLKVLVLGTVFAQSTIMLTLVVRRVVLVLHSWMLLDFWNGVVALNGSVAAFMAMLVVLFEPVRETWTYPPDVAEKAARMKNVDGLEWRVLCAVAYPLNALFYNLFYVYKQRSPMMLARLIRAVVLPLTMMKPVFMGMSPILYPLVLAGIMQEKLLQRSQYVYWGFWALFGIMMLNDFRFIYPAIGEQMRQVQEGYNPEQYHNWIWRDELSPYFFFVY